jgi:hypothetical protein
MKTMEEQIERFRRTVIEAAALPRFVHHRWYVDYHLVIVERIALELCASYPEADQVLVRLLVWLHDYGKILDRADERRTTLTRGRQALLDSGLPPTIVERALQGYERHEDYDALAAAPIEVRIVSSADAAAHLVGPFYALWWYENPDRPIESLMDDNRRKALFDWEKKMVLPEARAAFAARHCALLERCGDFPAAFLAGEAESGGS